MVVQVVNRCYHREMVEDLLQALELDKPEISVLDSLLQRGEMTVLALARDTGINRTTLYRVLDDMMRKGLVAKGIKNTTTVYTALSLDGLERLVDERLQKADRLRRLFEDNKEKLRKLRSHSVSPSNVKFYNGASECRQLLWNSLRGKVVKSFGYRTLKEVVGYKFFAQWWDEIIRRGREDYMLINPEDLESKRSVNEDEKYTIPLSGQSWFHIRTIDTDVLDIITETFIYDDVYAVLQWQDNDIYGVEVQNKVIARQEEAVFDLLWEIGKDAKL